MRKINYILFILLLVLIVISIVSYFVFKKETVAIIGAMDVEINEIIENLNRKKQEQTGSFTITTGYLGKYKVILSKSGVGKVNAATTTQFIIDKYKPKYIINIGLAGGLSPELKAGDMVLAEKLVQHDFDLTAFGNPKGYMETGIEPDKPTIYFSDKDLIDNFSEILKNKDVKRGMIATGDIFVKDLQTKKAIRKEFGADLADMESAAIAQTAERNNIPVIVLKTVSDGINDSEKEYTENKKDTAKQTALTVISILKE